MGKLIISGNGRDAGDEKKINGYAIAFGIIMLVVCLIFIEIGSDYHRIQFTFNEPLYGFRFGDTVIRAGFLRFVSIALAVAASVGSIYHMKPFFDSSISVYENGVT